ncbi:MAG: hypothetical protein WCB92_10710 [Mycobacterium sp.]
MHCHVLTHTVDGMMGSQLKVAPGALALALPSGKPCPSGTATPSGQDVIIKVEDFQFNPKNAMASAGQTLTWEWQADDHSTTSDYGIWDSGVQNKPHSFSAPSRPPTRVGRFATSVHSTAARVARACRPPSW